MRSVNFIIRVLIISMMAGTALSQEHGAAANWRNVSSLNDVTCEEALANAGEIKIGMTDTRVLELLGQPGAVANDVWGYNFWKCSPPPQIGNQMVVGLAITFEQGTVKKIDYATICAMGRPGKRKKGS